MYQILVASSSESKEELKSLLMKVKEESEIAGLRLNIKKKKKTKIIAPGPITKWQIEGEKVEIVRFPILGLQTHCRWWLQPWNQKMIASCQESDDKPRQYVEKHYSADKGPFSQGYGLPSGHVQF